MVRVADITAPVDEFPELDFIVPDFAATCSEPEPESYEPESLEPSSTAAPAVPGIKPGCPTSAQDKHSVPADTASGKPSESSQGQTKVSPHGLTSAATPDVEVKLPYKLTLRDYQKPVWDFFIQDKPGLRGLTIWPRRNGKDLIALNILVAKTTQRVGLYLYIGPLQTQIRQIIWMGATDSGRKFRDYIPQQLIKSVRNSQMEIDLINGSMIKLVGSDQYDALMGLNPVGVVFTEFSLQRPEAWDYIRPMLASNNGWALFNGTARGMNHMFTMAQMAKRNPKWFYEYYTRDDTGYPSLEAIEEDRASGMSEQLIKQEYYNSWTASSDSTFIPLDLAEPTTSPSAALQPKDYENEPRIFGCDVAYSAVGDKATICYRQGRKVHYLRWYKGYDNMAFANEIARLIDREKPHLVNIDAGRGEGVISRLWQLGYDDVVNGIHFNGKVYEEGIANMKALMWKRMLDWFANPNKPDLTGLDDHPQANEPVTEDLLIELTTPLLLIDEKNRISVESKASLKRRGVRSPDLAEGLALTFAEDLDARDIVPDEIRELQEMFPALAQKEQHYDPLNYMQELTE